MAGPDGGGEHAAETCALEQPNEGQPNEGQPNREPRGEEEKSDGHRRRRRRGRRSSGREGEQSGRDEPARSTRSEKHAPHGEPRRSEARHADDELDDEIHEGRLEPQS